MTLSANEIREKFLSFFEKEHNSTRVKSSSLIPDNPTVLLTTAGMLQFVPIFLGLEKPPYQPARATTCQKCARAGGKDSDIENVGRTPRHHTFFEMLGNFSFGDYFKKEIIPWSWDFVTNHLQLDKDKLWITVYQDDDEALDLWEKTGIAKERILRKGKKDNFWGPPGATGPCGPCSEIHYDLGKQFECSDSCSIDTCECDRWVEIWNLVFMELFQDENGNLSPLEKKNVDTGMGLERIAMIVQGKTSTFETDIMKPLIEKASTISNQKYGADNKTDISLRIITDHARCVTFMINDGIIPGNEGRNYVLRMILRRALRHGKLLGVELPFLSDMVETVVAQYKEVYPELHTQKEKIKQTILQEEQRFAQTLDKGQKLLDEVLASTRASNGCICAQDVFKLYDTFGFPLELTTEIANENGLKVDVDGFNELMREQKERAKNAAQKITLTDDLVYVELEHKFGATDFIGYEQLCADSRVSALVIDGKPVDRTCAEDIVDVVLNRTSFYAESGGQIGDTGALKSDDFEAEVLNTFKVGALFIHRCKIVSGEITINDNLRALVNAQRRHEITAHHTNAHMLQAALVNVLGDEVKQAGSQVEADRTRFDFSFPRALTSKEIEQVEHLVNKWIIDGLPQKTEVMNIANAKDSGATALFGEKYDNEVRVVSFGDISKELCGGCHAKSTSDLRLFKIISEAAVSAGARRIEALCSNAAFDYLNNKAQAVDTLSQKLKVPYSELEQRIDKMQDEIKSLQNELGILKSHAAKEKFNTFISKAVDINGGKLFITKVADFEPNALKQGIEMMESKLGECICVLVSTKDESLVIMAKVADSFVKQGISASDIVRKIATATEGKGGGKPNFAQGGGKNSPQLDIVLEEINTELLTKFK